MFQKILLILPFPSGTYAEYTIPMIMQLKNWILFLCAICDLKIQLKSPAVKRKAPLTDEDKEVASPAKRAKTAIDNNPEIQEQRSAQIMKPKNSA